MKNRTALHCPSSTHCNEHSPAAISRETIALRPWPAATCSGVLPEKSQQSRLLLVWGERGEREERERRERGGREEREERGGGGGGG